MAAVSGVDVGKANLDVSIAECPVIRFDNTAKGITKLLNHLRVQDATLALCESTGGYERLLVGRLRKAGMAVHVAHQAGCTLLPNPAATRPKPTLVMPRCCPATARCSPEPDVPAPDPKREELRDLLRRRRQFVEQQVQERNRLDKGISRAVATSTKHHIAWLDKETAELDREYQAALQCSAPLAQQAALYRTVPGVGPLTAAILVAHCRSWAIGTPKPSPPWWVWRSGPGTAAGSRASGASLEGAA